MTPLTLFINILFFHLFTNTIHCQDDDYYNYNNPQQLHQHEFKISEELPNYLIVDLVHEFGLQIPNDLKPQVEFEIPVSEEHKDLFRLDQKTGQIFTNEKGIDREEICHKEAVCRVELKVGLYKPSILFKLFTISIVILDINDHSPVFKPDSIDLNISEDAVLGYTLQLPQAFDDDLQKFEVQRYEITSQESIPSPLATSQLTDDVVFELIHEKSEASFLPDELTLKLIKELDFERSIAYKLTIEAFDGENKSGKLQVYVKVTDVNDNEPVFETGLYSISLNESFPVGASILTVKASDRDSGKNGMVEYLFHQAQSRMLQTFQLNALTGELSLALRLNHKQRKQFKFKIIARDLSSKPKYSFTDVHIDVIDINNFAPEITITPVNVQGNVELFENEPSFTFVFHLFVTDADSDLNGKVSCFLDDGDAKEIFFLSKLSEQEYKLVTRNSTVIDKESTDFYTVTVTCRDHGEPLQSSQKTVTIQIKDVDDNTPYFKEEYIVKIAENNEIGRSIVQVTAYDADVALGSQFKYSLCNEEKDSRFVKVDEDNGIIVTSMSFDYEEIKSLEICIKGENECQNCTQQEKNTNDLSSTSTTTKLLIEIIDINDNNPLFEQDYYEFEVDENASINVVLGEVKASDADSDSYNQFDYNIFETKSEFPFKIDPISGVLSTNGHAIDRETKDTYLFNVYAIDLKNRSLFSETEVLMKVLDLNDNPPEFHSNCSDVELFLDLNILTEDPMFVCALSVLDRDASNNSELRVETQKMFNVEVFAANQSSDGLFFLPASLLQLPEYLLTRDQIIHFNVTTTASDLGTPPLFSQFQHSIKLNLGGNFTVTALKAALSKKAHLPTLPFIVGIIIFAVCLIIIAIVILFVKIKSKKEKKKMFKKKAPIPEASYYESLKKNNHNNNKSNPIYTENLKDRNIFTDSKNPEENFMIQTNMNNNGTNNGNALKSSNPNNKNIRSEAKDKSSKNIWDKYFKSNPNKNNQTKAPISVVKVTTTKDPKSNNNNNIYNLVQDSPPRRQIFFNPDQSVDSRNSVMDEEEPKQKVIIPTMYSTYKPDEIFYNDEARTHLGLPYCDDEVPVNGDNLRTSGHEAGVDEHDASHDDADLKAYDSYSSMPRNLKLKTFFDPDNNTNYDLHNTRTLSNSSSFKNITNTNYNQ